MTRTCIACVTILLVSNGCVTPTARRVEALSRYKATDEDRHEQDEAFSGVDAIAKKDLRLGMVESEVLRIMGRPMIPAGSEPSRVRIWTYLVSVSGTWTYSVGFVDGELVYFGELNPQWLGEPIYDKCTDPGIQMMHEIRKHERTFEHPSAPYSEPAVRPPQG